jgi:hypothetical protein
MSQYIHFPHFNNEIHCSRRKVTSALKFDACYQKKTNSTFLGIYTVEL